MCIIDNCNYVEKHGNYCYKHRRNYLIDTSSGKIILEHWTNKCSDYLKKDIIDNLCDSWYFWNQGHQNPASYGNMLVDKSKQELFLLLANKINSLEKYNEKDIQRIIQLQNKIKNKKKNQLNQLRGEGFLDKSLSNNDTDFFTYDSRDEINDKYYFSYRDEKVFYGSLI